MIFVDIMGGLGNQLFQYATARSISLDKSTDFLMNLSDYEKEDAQKVEHVDFKLHHFNVDTNKQIDEKDIMKYDDVQKIIEPLSSTNFSKFIDFNKYSGNIHLKGYWQNERYFKHNSHFIKNELRVITPPNSKNQKILDEISESNSVCISFRRGEYLDPYFISQFGMCTEDYYKKAINYISSRVKNPTFFVFSDDIEWIEENVKLDFPTVPVSVNGVGEEHEELRLMMSCEHFILANSSFSWWGAWLSDNPNKNVFAPTPWFNSFTKQSILCPDWIHLKCDRSDLFKKSEFKLFELVTEEDLNNLEYNGFTKSIGKFGIALNVKNEDTKIKFKFNEKYICSFNEYLIEFKLFSNKRGLIKIDYGEPRNIVLGYNKGYSNKYLHLSGINLNNIILNMSDDELIIENITIKSINSNFKLVLSKK